MSALVPVALVVLGMGLLEQHAPAARARPRAAPAPPPEERSLLRRLRWGLSGGAFFGGWLFVGGVVGMAAGALCAVLAARVLGRVASPALLRRHRELERDLPLAVHLYGAALTAGSSISRALDDVAAALPGPVSDELVLVVRRLELGSDPATVWRALEGPLRPLGRTMARAHESGASTVRSVERLADELQSSARGRRDALARTVEVRAAAPLGLCFLPAFVLLGVVPMVVGIFTSLHLFA